MLFLFITILLMISLAVAVYNFYTAPMFRAASDTIINPPMVSVLVPARNEEDNIGSCLTLLAEQDYKCFEIIAGNDNSDDNTGTIIKQLAYKYPSVKMIDIPELPKGWKGKNFAADTLYRSAKGEILLFIDADVKMNRDALRSAVMSLIKYKADVLSVFPVQRTLSFGEKLIVPLLNFFLLSLLPLIQVYRSSHSSFSAGIGQFLMFRRFAYELLGGHSNFRNEIAEDLELIRAARKNRLKVLAMIDSGLTECRMYTGFAGAVNGFTKNFFKGSSLSALAFLLFLSVYSFVFFAPFVLIIYNSIYIIPLIIILLIRLLIALRTGENLYEIFLHPLQIPVLYFTGIRSLLAGDKVHWKGRTV